LSEKEKRGSTSLALKAGFWYVVSNFLGKAISYITTPLFARLMSAEQYGEFSNYASWQSTLLILTSAELYNTLSRAYYDYTEDYDKYISSVATTIFLITTGVYTFFLLNQQWIFSVVAIPQEYVHLLFFTLLFQSCKAIWLARERTLYRYKTVALVSVLNLLIPTLVALALVLLLPETQRLGGRLYGTYLPISAIGIYCAVDMFSKARCFRLEHVKYALKLSLPLLVHYLTAYLLTSSNTMITKSIMGAKAAAIVSITTSTIHILTILFQSASGAVTTWLMDNLEQEKYVQLRKHLVIYVLGICVVAMSVFLLGPEVIWVLGGTQYAQATTLLPGMIVAVTVQAITTIFTIILTYKKRVVGVAICTSVAAAASVVAKIILLPRYGIEVLPLINIVAYGALFICDYILVCRAG